jgi:intracellular protein transport protein USO1
MPDETLLCANWQAILAAPMGVNRLLGMMEEGHEVIRNEAILLLVGLTRASPELQKIAAFQGAFGRLLHIVRSANPHALSRYLQ